MVNEGGVESSIAFLILYIRHIRLILHKISKVAFFFCKEKSKLYCNNSSPRGESKVLLVATLLTLTKHLRLFESESVLEQ